LILQLSLATTVNYSELFAYGSGAPEIEKVVDSIERHIVDASSGGEPTLFPAPLGRGELSTTRNRRSQQMSTRASVARKTTERTTFNFEPSAIDGRYNVSIETGTPPYVKFGAVLTRREVQALIECLSVGLQDRAEEDEKSS
jgi:hypothetical protein